MKPKTTILYGSTFAFFSVALGAFAAHGLKLDAYHSSVFEIAVRYQFYHSLALIIFGIGKMIKTEMFCPYTPPLFSVGIIIFSGSLYALAVTDIKILGAITPIGGICFLLGWLFQIVKLARFSE